MIAICAGMPRAGSGWHFNLINSLLVASGHQDARDIRQKYRLGAVLTEVNCNIGSLTPLRLGAVMVPSLLGKKFAVKTHSRPTAFSRFLEKSGGSRSLYIYRDPRDALLSAIEYGHRSREANRHNAFAELNDFDKAIKFMQRYTAISQEWLSYASILCSRYEDLLLDYREEVTRLLEYLAIDPGIPAVKHVVEELAPGEARGDQPGMHFRKGKIGRYLSGFTDQQIRILNDTFAEYLSKNGYST